MKVRQMMPAKPRPDSAAGTLPLPGREKHRKKPRYLEKKATRLL